MVWEHEDPWSWDGCGVGAALCEHSVRALSVQSKAKKTSLSLSQPDPREGEKRLTTISHPKKAKARLDLQ